MASAVIVAAGRGERMQSPVAKQFLEIGGVPVLVRTLRVFARHPWISEIMLVVAHEDISLCRTMILPEFGEETAVRITEGGLLRQDSVYKGLLAVGDTEKIVVIHDGVRPFVSRDLISECIEGAEQSGACIAGMPVSDTLKRVECGNMVSETLPRERIWTAQTPQAFRYDLIKSAFDMAIAEGFTGTDDAFMLERTGRPVRIIEGSWRNIKITTPGDLELAGQLLKITKTSNGKTAEVKHAK
ncbi:MAG: 2-C-methyl-D-erythritol 4-phosphate cytidylyltransferase [Desulfobacterales bacterium]|nr:2-C-methyl-D-erythritol 4-phosphate cytidylyltransferase [Desulfobacterales bacterium]